MGYKAGSRMMMVKNTYSPTSSSHHNGTAFILLALFAGLVGGLISLPFFNHFKSTETTTLHGFLMSFFVICPAFLGGICQWLLPKFLSSPYRALPSFLTSSWGLFALGVIFLPLRIEIGMVFWCFGSLLLASYTIINILEARSIRFRDFSPFIWSSLFTSCTLLIISPIIFALIVKNYSLSSFLPLLHIPEMALILTSALGLVSLIFPSEAQNSQKSFFWRSSPYLLGTLSLLSPLLWTDKLFGGMDFFQSHDFYMSLSFENTLCVLLYLSIFFMCFWRHSLSFNAVSLWSLTTMISLMVGALRTLSHLISTSSSETSSHQILIFGCLFALFTGFYSWFSEQLTQLTRFKTTYFFTLWGGIHLAITLCGFFTAFLFPNLLFPYFLMLISLSFFASMGIFIAHLFFQSRNLQNMSQKIF